MASIRLALSAVFALVRAAFSVVPRSYIAFISALRATPSCLGVGFNTAPFAEAARPFDFALIVFGSDSTSSSAEAAGPCAVVEVSSKFNPNCVPIAASAALLSSVPVVPCAAVGIPASTLATASSNGLADPPSPASSDGVTDSMSTTVGVALSSRVSGVVRTPPTVPPTGPASPVPAA